jgi:hypothetical protein
MEKAWPEQERPLYARNADMSLPNGWANALLAGNGIPLLKKLRQRDGEVCK